MGYCSGDGIENLASSLGFRNFGVYDLGLLSGVPFDRNIVFWGTLKGSWPREDACRNVDPMLLYLPG